MDLGMGTPRAGVDAIKTIATLAPSIRLIVLTLFSDDDNVFSDFEVGASDYVLKNSSTGEILEAIRMTVNDVFPLRPQIARLIRAELQALRSERNVLIVTLNIVFYLSPRELGILRLLVKGKDANEIAELQNVEFLIIRTYVRNILKKFGESSVNDIVNRLHRLGISEILTNDKVLKVK